MTWPTKNDFVDGDVLTAAQVNNIGNNLNEFDPTSASSGQVWVADGAGSGAYASPGGGLTLLGSVALTSGSSQSVTGIATTYQNLYIRIRNVTVTSAAGCTLQFGGVTGQYREATRFASQAAKTADAYDNTNMTGNQSDLVVGSFGTTVRGQFHFWIHDYASASTPRKTVYKQGTTYDGVSTFRVEESLGFTWASGGDAAITQVTIAASGTTFTGGSLLIYGI